MDLDGDVIWRSMNAALAAGTFIVMFWNTRKIWNIMSSRARLLTQAQCAMLFAVSWGSVENIIQQNPLGPRTAIVSAAVLWNLTAFIGTDHAFTMEEEVEKRRKK
jgi:hypothetical protein